MNEEEWMKKWMPWMAVAATILIVLVVLLMSATSKPQIELVRMPTGEVIRCVTIGSNMSCDFGG